MLCNTRRSVVAVWLALPLLLAAVVVVARKGPDNEKPWKAWRDPKTDPRPETNWAEDAADQLEARPQDPLTANDLIPNWSEKRIKCRVCIAAIDDIWKVGANRRAKCEAQENFHEIRDHECNGRAVPIDRVREIVTHSCDHLPDRHSAEHDHAEHGFKLTRTYNDIPHNATQEEREQEDQKTNEHPGEGRAAMTNACKKFLHERHTIEKITQHAHTNLRNNMPTERALPLLRKRFCFHACEYGTRRRGGHREPRMQYHEDL